MSPGADRFRQATNRSKIRFSGPSPFAADLYKLPPNTMTAEAAARKLKLTMASLRFDSTYVVKG
jgi:hypothetical protein